MNPRRPVDDRSPVTRAVDKAFSKGFNKPHLNTPTLRKVPAGVLVLTPAWDRTGCKEQVCYCHDETAAAYSCSACGCRAGETMADPSRNDLRPLDRAIYDVWDAVEAALLPVLKKQDKAALRYLAERSDYSSAFRELCAQAASRRGK